jgi:hypothetical protein
MCVSLKKVAVIKKYFKYGDEFFQQTSALNDVPFKSALRYMQCCVQLELQIICMSVKGREQYSSETCATR